MSSTTNPLPRISGGYQVIYADPAWPYKNKRTRAAATKHYKTIALAEMKALPVLEIAANDCALFMWAVPPMLKTAFELGEAWGFDYKTIGFLWAKRNRKSNTPFFGMGNYTRANAEPCLLFTRGNPKRVSAAVPQLVVSPILRHSEKPPEVRRRIERLMGDVRRVELFSRHHVQGWDRWGNEVLP